MAYYMVYMSEGKGMFGFISLPESPVPSSLMIPGAGDSPFHDQNNTGLDAETMSMIMLSNSKAKDMNVTEGRDAFQIFFEQFLY